MSSDFTVVYNEYMPLREFVYTTLRRAILKGEFKPGERLMEIRLAQKLGVSRTPIREAIRRLSDEQLVIMTPRKGAVVAGISEKLLKDVLAVRMTLERMAYECAFIHITDDHIRRLREAEKCFEDAVADDDIVRMTDEDEKFHFIICEASGNDKLSELLESLRENMYRYRMEHCKDVASRQDLIREHNAIIATLVDRDVVNGLRLVHEHISKQEKLILAKIEDDLSNNQIVRGS